MKTLGAYAVIRWKLREVMEAKDISNRELARRTGLHEFTIARLKAGVTQIHTETLNKLCAALECNPGDLIQYEPDEGGQ